MKIKMENLNEFYIKKLEQQVEQLQAELAAVNSEKEHKLPEWNDKEAEWQSIYPPGATIVMPLPPADGKVTIVKEKFYPADKELIEQLQADNARLREEFDELTNLPIKWYVSEREARFVFATTDDRDEFVKYIIGVKALASTDSSNWLQEQKAQWRREVLEEAAQWFDETDPWSYGDERTVRRNVQEELRRMAKEQ